MKPSACRVLDALREQGRTGIDAYDDFPLHGSGRLAARVGELRRAGFDISTEYVTPPGRTRRAVYRILERPVQVAMFGDAPVGGAKSRVVPPTASPAHQAAAGG